MNFFKDTKKTVIFVCSIILVIILALGGLIVAEKYSAENNTSKQDPVIELTTDKVIVSTGEKFDAKEYIKVATDSSGNDVKDKVESPELNTDVTGNYEITYSFKDGDKTIKSKTLKVIVAKKNENKK